LPLPIELSDIAVVAPVTLTVANVTPEAPTVTLAILSAGLTTEAPVVIVLFAPETLSIPLTVAFRADPVVVVMARPPPVKLIVQPAFVAMVMASAVVVENDLDA